MFSLEEVFIGNDLDSDPIKRQSPRYSAPMHSCYVDRKLVADEMYLRPYCLILCIPQTLSFSHCHMHAHTHTFVMKYFDEVNNEGRFDEMKYCMLRATRSP